MTGAVDRIRRVVGGAGTGRSARGERRDSWSRLEPSEWRHPVLTRPKLVKIHKSLARPAPGRVTRAPAGRLVANCAGGFALFPSPRLHAENGDVPLDQHQLLRKNNTGN